MTNILYSKTAPLNIYVANLAEYNNGNLVGSWISLPIEENDWKDFLKTIGNPAEYVTHDFDNNIGLDGLKIGKYESIDKLNNLTRRLSNLSPYEITVINALYEVLEDLEQALDYYESDNYVYYGDMTLEEIAQENIKEYYDIPEGLENYIDYRLYASDMDIEGFYYKTTYGTIEML